MAFAVSRIVTDQGVIAVTLGKRLFSGQRIDDGRQLRKVFARRLELLVVLAELALVVDF